MKKRLLLFAILTTGLLAQVSFGQDKKNSSAEEKTTFVKGTRLLEQDPFHKKAKDIRSSLLFWLIEAPDVSVTLCSDFLEPVGKKYKYAPEMTGQFTYGMGAFMIENPDKAKDEKAVYVGGLESVSKMYESMLKVKSEAKNSYLDSLVEKRTNGGISQLVTEVLSKGGCKSE